MLDTLRLLVDLGADVNATNNAGDAPIHRAAYRRLEPVVQFLAEHGAQLDAKNKRGQTPIVVTRTGGDAGADSPRSGARTEALLRKLGATVAEGQPDPSRGRFE